MSIQKWGNLGAAPVRWQEGPQSHSWKGRSWGDRKSLAGVFLLLEEANYVHYHPFRSNMDTKFNTSKWKTLKEITYWEPRSGLGQHFCSEWVKVVYIYSLCDVMSLWIPLGREPKVSQSPNLALSFSRKIVYKIYRKILLSKSNTF